jgi:Zn-dependent alcohol dehydrogenase
MAAVGAVDVVVSDTQVARLPLAKKMGATAVVDASRNSGAVADLGLLGPEGCTNSSPPHSTSRVPTKVPMGELDGQRAKPS